MKRIIDGLRYDTETATGMASWNNGCGGGDFHQCKETLYRTKSGRYFVHGDGGALSRWASSFEGGRSHGPGEGIIALTPQEALLWLEEHALDIPDGCPEIAALVVEA